MGPNIDRLSIVDYFPCLSNLEMGPEAPGLVMSCLDICTREVWPAEWAGEERVLSGRYRLYYANIRNLEFSLLVTPKETLALEYSNKILI